MSKNNIYFTNYGSGEKDLHDLEFRTLFGDVPTNKILMSNINFDPSRSIFIKEKLEILCESNDLDYIVTYVSNLNLSYDTYKFHYINYKYQKDLYQNNLDKLAKIVSSVNGKIDLKTPNNLIGITKIGDIWYFGIVHIGRTMCEKHQWKPHSYSVSCGVRIARVMANLAVGHNLNLSIIDPCCGAGTVVLELLSIGANTFANELNNKVVIMAQENLKYFGYDFNVTQGDICNIKEKYDVAILDIPYGHFTKIEESAKKTIIQESARIADKLIILTNVKMDAFLEEANFKIIDTASVDKRGFRRYLTICEK